MPLVVRYIEPRREKHSSNKTPLPRPLPERPQSQQDLPEEYKEIDKMLTVSSSVPILESVSTNPLQALMVHRLSSCIRELASLAQHAEGIIGSIADDLASCHARSTRLEERARRLREEVLPSLDPEQEAIEGFEIPHPDFQFKSRREGGQLMLSKHPPPPPLAAVIQAAHKPHLHHFTEFWPDGRNALTMYSDPSFFFEQWMSSVKKGALLRRKSSGHVLSPTGSKPNGGKFESLGRVSPVGGPKKLRRSATMVSRSSRKKARPLSYHSSSNLSLDKAGLPAKSKNFQRTYSVRVTPGYRSAPRKEFKIPKSKYLNDPLSKSIAALFSLTEVTAAAATPGVEKTSVKTTPTKSDSASKLQRGGIRRSFSLRRSRSKSPAPPSSKATPESSVSTQKLEDSTSSSDITIPPKKKLPEEVETSGPKAASTFKSASGLPSRSNVPVLARISTPTTLRPRTTSDASNPQSVSPLQRSKTVAGPNNANLKNVAARVRDRVRASPRPASMIGLSLPGKESPLLGKASSQSSLRTSSSHSSSNGRPRSMLLTIDDDIPPLTQDLAPKSSASSKQSRKPRRPAPPKPSGADSPRGRGTPDSVKMGSSTPLPSASPTPTTTDGDTSSSNAPAPTKTDPSIETNQLDSASQEKDDSSVPVKRSPPPPPQRNHSLSNAPNSQTATAQGPIAGSGPATPGTAHTAAVTQSSLDADRRQSVAIALTEVLSNMSRRNPLSPTSPLPLNGDLNRTITPDKSAALETVMSPVTPRGGTSLLDATLTPFEHSPKFGMSPINSFHTPNSSTPLPTGTFGKSPRIPPSKRQFFKRGSGSLYISPHKLTTAIQENGEVCERAEEILRAGGVENGAPGDATRNDLLVAIRKGIRLKKVEEEAARSNAEVAWDVAAILERYEVLHSESDEDSDQGDEDWMDDYLN